MSNPSLTPEEQKRFDNYFDMFMTPGWAQLVEELEERIKQAGELDNINSPEEFWVSKGRIGELRLVARLKEITEATYAANIANLEGATNV